MAEITREELIADLEQYFRLPPRQENDLSLKDLMEIFDCKKETVRTKMKVALDEGNYQKHKVWDPDSSHHIVVYRKVNNGTNNES